MSIVYLTRRRLTITILLAFLLVGTLLIVPSAAYAQEGIPSTDGGAQLGEQIDEALELYFIRLQLAVENQQARIDASYRVIDATRQALPLAAELGVDTGPIEAATNTFEAEVARAQGPHDEGAAIVAARAGFDAEGKVVDREAAVATVRDATQKLVDASDIMIDATLDWRIVFRDFSDALRDVLES